MTTLDLARLACPVISAACLAGGLGMAGQGLAAGAALLAGLALLLTRRWPAVWLATGSLVALAALSAAGLLFNAAPILMLAGATAALAGWDLSLAEFARPAESPRGGLLDQRHLRSLALVLGAGLLAAAVGRNVHLQLPFIVIGLLVGLGVWALERVIKGMGQ